MKIVAFTRDEQGTGASRRLRNEGMTPAIVYGGEKDSVNIKLDHNALWHAIANESFHSSIHELEIDGVVDQVLLRDFQLHAFKQRVMHVDFQRINTEQPITIKVPLRFENAANSPAVKLSGARVNQSMKTLEVTCLPKDLPEFITVDLSNLVAKETIHLESVPMPEGVTATGLGKKKPVASATKAR